MRAATWGDMPWVGSSTRITGVSWWEWAHRKALESASMRCSQPERVPAGRDGSLAPRNGEPGWDGELYGGTEVYRYFKREQGARTAAVVSCNQAASASYARLVTRGLRAEGYEVVTEQLDFALPNFRAAAADLREQGADLVFDALDTHGTPSSARRWTRRAWR